MKIEKATKVFTCCGKYYAVTKEAATMTIKCPNCGKTLSGSLRTPIINIVSK